MMKTKAIVIHFIQPLMPSAMLWILFCVAADHILDVSGYYLPKETLSDIKIMMIFVCIFCTSLFYFKEYKKRLVWNLDDQILTRGSPVNLTIDLTKIDKIILGLPKSKWDKFKLDHSIFLKYSFILKLNDNEYLPIYLFKYLPSAFFELNGGLALMNEIFDKNSDKVDLKYEFSKKEEVLSKKRYSNSLVNF